MSFLQQLTDAVGWEQNVVKKTLCNVTTNATVFAGKIHKIYFKSLLNFSANSFVLANISNTLLCVAFHSNMTPYFEI